MRGSRLLAALVASMLVLSPALAAWPPATGGHECCKKAGSACAKAAMSCCFAPASVPQAIPAPATHAAHTLPAADAPPSAAPAPLLASFTLRAAPLVAHDPRSRLHLHSVLQI